MVKKNKFYNSVYFRNFILFLFVVTSLYAQNQCNDEDAMNYNSDASSVDDCVYFNNIPNQNIDEDTSLQL